MASVDEHCAAAFAPPLLRLGFACVGPRRWVRGGKAPLREIFGIEALKGGIYAARWGFSLDFVPLCRGARLKWKRTDRTAEFDLCIDPIDEAGTVPGWCSFPDPAAGARAASALAAAARATLAAAERDFEPVSSPAELLHVFERRARMAFKRFGPDDYVQTHLAWGLCLLAAGRAAEAAPHIARFCGENGIDRADPVLVAAEATAQGLARGTGMAPPPHG